MPQLPISNALEEATPDSISDLLNRDPEGLTDADLDRLITELRANRERYEAAEANRPARVSRADKSEERELREVAKAMARRNPLEVRPLPAGKL